MASPIPLDPYEVLGVARDATLSAIRSAHRKLVLKHHPDRIKDDAERQKGTEEFQKAQQAYELLSDEKRRTRYDDQVKLAALRKEAMMADRTVPMRSASFPMQTQTTAARPPPPPPAAYEYRDGRMYEERRPRYSDEDERWAEPQVQRPSARKAASTYERRPTSSYKDEKAKKSSEKPTGFTDFMQSKLREKAKQARERAAHTESAKNRDKDRRKDTEAKHSTRRAYVESDDDSSSGSDTITYVSRNPAPKKSETKKPEPRRRATYEVPPTAARKSRESERTRASRENTESSSDSDSSSDDEDEDEWARKHRDATAYISERSVPGRPGVLRTDSAHYIAPKDKASGRKSGSDKDDLREERTRSSRARRPPPIEVVEPSKRNPHSRKAPSMTTANSSPAGLKGMTGHREAPQPHRSSTGEYPVEHKRPVPSMKRAETMPVPPISTRRESGRGSKLKQSETMDSGYGSSSPATPEMRGTSPPKSSSKKYFIVEEDAEHARASYRTVPIPEEEYPSRRTRSPSPPPRERERDRDGGRKRERPERPSVQTSASYAKGTRPSQYTMSPDQMSARPTAMRTESARSAMRGDAPPLSRGESGRHLYGEVNKDDGYRFSPDNVRYSPKTGDVRYTHTRRGSDDRNKDCFNGSSHYDNLHSPKNGRRESVY